MDLYTNIDFQKNQLFRVKTDKQVTETWVNNAHPLHAKVARGIPGLQLQLGRILFSRSKRWERNENELTWINGTALRKGRQVVGGPPWDRIPGKVRKVTAEDALFFVSKNGRLVQFTVALRKFKWKDCRKLPNTKIAYIVDQEMFRDNIVFAVGRNGRLYQYNKVTELWHA
ncbi:Large neutral amino acids transporter small subunit like [Thalictrum thalictroides]|uniref:Large neutral amino acids transporter small subunit like n=1 Tax=Thalictrum thalictroides TaxID=46969 RepID=A0A7J6WIE2_THATH|nr:Large neutral amino acids transporter small subunit like [Thalictrum thalictroides]